jgi:hypothetical protein
VGKFIWRKQETTQLKGCVTKTRKRRHGIRNRKSTEKQLITYFLWRLEALFNLASDKDAHLDRSTIITQSDCYNFAKPNRIQPQDQGETNTDKKRNNHRREKKKEDFRRVRWFSQARPPTD